MESPMSKCWTFAVSLWKLYVELLELSDGTAEVPVILLMMWADPVQSVLDTRSFSVETEWGAAGAPVVEPRRLLSSWR